MTRPMKRHRDEGKRKMIHKKRFVVCGIATRLRSALLAHLRDPRVVAHRSSAVLASASSLPLSAPVSSSTLTPLE